MVMDTDTDTEMDMNMGIKIFGDLISDMGNRFNPILNQKFQHHTPSCKQDSSLPEGKDHHVDGAWPRSAGGSGRGPRLHVDGVFSEKSKL
jgi:hypothetical protein